MKNEAKLVGAAFGALIGLAIALLVMSFTGCATKPDGSSDYCANAQKSITAYEASLAVRTPTADETKIYTAAKAILVLYCGAPGAVVPADSVKVADVATIPKPRQPQRIVTTDSGARVIYYLEVPFSILSGGEIFRGPAVPTITIGPLYRTADPSRKQYLWLPDQAWLQKTRQGEPTMLPIR